MRACCVSTCGSQRFSVRTATWPKRKRYGTGARACAHRRPAHPRAGISGHSGCSSGAPPVLCKQTGSSALNNHRALYRPVKGFVEFYFIGVHLNFHRLYFVRSPLRPPIRPSALFIALTCNGRSTSQVLRSVVTFDPTLCIRCLYRNTNREIRPPFKTQCLLITYRFAGVWVVGGGIIAKEHKHLRGTRQSVIRLNEYAIEFPTSSCVTRRRRRRLLSLSERIVGV